MQRTRPYGDYLYYQDREKFEMQFKEWISEAHKEITMSRCYDDTSTVLFTVVFEDGAELGVDVAEFGDHANGAGNGIGAMIDRLCSKHGQVVKLVSTLPTE